jgi:hypothetical protein
MLSPASQPDVNVPSGDGRQPVDRGPADDNDAGQRFGSARDTGRISHCIGNGLPPQPLGGANEFGRESAIARSICPHLKRITVSAQSAKLHYGECRDEMELRPLFVLRLERAVLCLRIQ